MTVHRSLAWKRRLGQLHKSVFGIPDGSQRRLILIYHSVQGGPWSTSVSQFDQQLAWLSRNANVIPLEVLLADAGSGSWNLPRVALTFDDGYRTLYDIVAPRLSRFGFSATVYLNTGFIEETSRQVAAPGMGLYPDEQFLTWPEIRSLRHGGWAIGSHGVDHIDLTLQTPQVIDEQLQESKQCIEMQLGKPCNHFSYTWGRHNALVRERVAAAGYLSAVAGHHGPVRHEESIFSIPRMDVRMDYSLSDFVAMVSGDWDFLGLKHRLAAGGLRD